MAKIDKKYHKVLTKILNKGKDRGDRTGTGTRSIGDAKIKYNMKNGFPLLTTKKMAIKNVITELLWFLSGDTNIQTLVKQGNNIWVGDSYKKYEKSFDIDPNNFDAEEVSSGHNDQCWGYPTLDHVKPTSNEYKRGQINAYLEGKAEKPFFYLTKKEFIEQIKTDDEFAKKWGELGPVYGKQWRDWDEDTGTKIDQIQQRIDTLKTNPECRRQIVSAWNVLYLPHMVLPPCHWAFELYTEELTFKERRDLAAIYAKENNKIPLMIDAYGFKGIPEYMDAIDNSGWEIPKRRLSLKWHQRSVDVPLGLPFNIASYAFLLEMFAQQVNMVPGMLIGDLSNVHIYQNQMDGVKEQLSRDTSKFKSPKLKLNKAKDIFSYKLEDFEIVDYESDPTIKFPLSN